MKTLFALLGTHKEKRPSRIPVNLKKTEFVPASDQAGSSSCTFHPEETGAGDKVQSKKLYWLKRKLLHLQGPLESKRFIHTYIHTYITALLESNI